MTAKIFNPAPFLREQRKFPEEPQPLSVEIDRSYTDIANKMNARTIGMHVISQPLANGEKWVEDGEINAGFRQVYRFAGASSIPHHLTIASIKTITRITGTFKDAAGVWYPLPYVSHVAANNQISVVVNATNIVITAGAGAPPTISTGTIILEWF